MLRIWILLLQTTAMASSRPYVKPEGWNRVSLGHCFRILEAFHVPYEYIDVQSAEDRERKKQVFNSLVRQIQTGTDAEKEEATHRLVRLMHGTYELGAID